jgi:hypothetical protein
VLSGESGTGPPARSVRRVWSTAEPYSELIATVPLVDGAGSAPAPAQEPQFVRIVDAAGALVLAGPATALAD